MKILGISAYYHDSAAALVVDSEIVAAAQEERFTRLKHDNRFPENAIRSVLEISGLYAKDIDLVVFYENPETKFDRVLDNAIKNFPKGFKNFQASFSRWIRNRLNTRREISQFMSSLDSSNNWNKKIRFSNHHLSHAASAFYPSHFSEAAVVTIDGVGEWTTAAIYKGKKDELIPICEIHYPHSLGLLYSAFTQYLGFKVNSGEYKVMGLAPYGKPAYLDIIKNNLITIYDDGSFRLNLKYFDFPIGETMINKDFVELFGYSMREGESPITQFHMDVASSMQKVVEEVMTKIAYFAKAQTGSENLCLAGGVSLNCVANGLILRKNIFKNIWIQPAAGDAGGALGAALLGAKWSGELDRNYLHSKNTDNMKGAYLGSEFKEKNIKDTLDNLGAKYTSYSEEDEFLEKVARHIANDKIVGWFQGRMEFGPRALGSRSILGNAVNPNMQSRINLKIKYRESFRPFAPSVLEEDCNKYFNLSTQSPYMLLVAFVKDDIRYAAESNEKMKMQERLRIKRSLLPSITHVDFSARVQTVDGAHNTKYFRLLKKFKVLSDYSALINTSFNIRGEPIVCTPEDAYRCFMGTEMDVLAIGNCILLKSDQPKTLLQDYKKGYKLD